MLLSISTNLPFLIIYIITNPISVIPVAQNVDLILSISSKLSDDQLHIQKSALSQGVYYLEL